jgi:ketosteroid isomerase-like protein
MRLYPLLYPGVLVLVVPVLIIAYYMGVRRSASSAPRSNGIRGRFLKVLLLVCLTWVAITALLVSAANPANHRGPSVSFAYVQTTRSHNDTADTLRQLEAEFMKAAAERGSQGYLSYYAEDSVELPNGGPIIQGRSNIGKGMGFLDQKDNHLTWTPVGADISASGDLGYTYGTFEFRSKDKDGKPTVDRGKYTSIWKKQKDGSWKVVLDMGNGSSQPAQ